MIVQARVRKVGDITFQRYLRAREDFLQYARVTSLPTRQHVQLDQAVSQYFGSLWHGEEEVAPAKGRDCLYGLQLIDCRIAKSLFLPNAKAQLDGWNKDMPYGMRKPVAEEIIHSSLAAALEVDGNLEQVLCSLLQLDSYFRPSVAVNLKKLNFSMPSKSAGPRYNHITVTEAPSECKQRSKTGEVDVSVILCEHCQWLQPLLVKYLKPLQEADEVCPNLTLDRLEKWWRDRMSALGLEPGLLGAHIMRHSGISNDVCHKRRTLEEAGKRGSWESKKSLKRYEKQALLSRSWKQVPKGQHALVKARAAKLPALVKKSIDKHVK